MNLPSSSSSVPADEVNGMATRTLATHPAIYEVIVFFGDGIESFRNHQILSIGAGSFPYYATVADVNKDTIDDVATSNRHLLG